MRRVLPPVCDVRSSAALLIAVVFLCGCASPAPTAQVGRIYDRAARYHGPERNPVVVIPGILGSRLVDGETGEVVWGAFAGDWANPDRPDDARLIALPMAEGVPLRDLTDGVRADGVLDVVKVEFLKLPVEQRAYVDILRTLGAGGYVDQSLGTLAASPGMAGADMRGMAAIAGRAERGDADARTIDYGPGHFTCFQFAYDWRRDLPENAAALDAFLRDRAAYVQRERHRRGLAGAGEPVKFDLVAHSMGGLLARYYLRYGGADLPDDPDAVPWAGAELVDRAVLIGTPSAGSAGAIERLVNGIKPAFFLPRYPPTLLGTIPGVYDLLPRARHRPLIGPGGVPLDPYDPAVWERFGWGLASRSPRATEQLAVLLPDVPDPADRRRIALDHLRKCLRRAERLADALDAPADSPPGLGLFLLAGDAIDTASAYRVAADGAISVAETSPGDGTVVRASALLDERAGGDWSPTLRSPVRWSGVTLLAADHLGLTRDPAFVDNVLYLLLEDPRR